MVVCCCSVAKSCMTLCGPRDCNMPGFPILHHLPESVQTHVYWVGDAIQPSHPLSPPSPFAFNLTQHQGLFQWVDSSHQVTKVLELQLIFFFICSEFCHTLKWNSHGFTCVPHPDPPSHRPLHPLPLGFPSAPGPSACLMHPTWAGHEKMLNITHYQRNANQNHNEVPLHANQDGCYPKVYKQ